MSQESLYAEVADRYASALDRLARAYERDSDARRDLLQEIHLQLWRSFAVFDARCSLRTWMYRVAHNVATQHAMRRRKMRERLVGVEEIESMPDTAGTEASITAALTEAQALERLYGLIHNLRPLDRQVIVSWLEGMDAKTIAEITGLSPANVAMKVHRIGKVLRVGFEEGERDV